MSPEQPARASTAAAAAGAGATSPPGVTNADGVDELEMADITQASLKEAQVCMSNPGPTSAKGQAKGMWLAGLK